MFKITEIIDFGLHFTKNWIHIPLLNLIRGEIFMLKGRVLIFLQVLLCYLNLFCLKHRMNCLVYPGAGASIMEISHRSKIFDEFWKVQKIQSKILNMPDSYKVIFTPGGATMQFSMLA